MPRRRREPGALCCAGAGRRRPPGDKFAFNFACPACLLYVACPLNTVAAHCAELQHLYVIARIMRHEGLNAAAVAPPAKTQFEHTCIRRLLIGCRTPLSVTARA